MARIHIVSIQVLLAVAGLKSASAFAATDRVYRDDFEPGISAPAQTWTWISVPGARCGNGSATGIGINMTAASSRLLIYLEGGGACWSDATCYTLHTAANFANDYGQSEFASDIASFGTIDIFDRTSSSNPFKDYNYVFVPYCTGDNHAGDNIVEYPSGTGYHVGFVNMTLDLQRLADTFRISNYAVLSGSSSGGGFGAVLNWWQTQEALPSARVDMIDDSGAFMPESVLPSPNTTEIEQRANWNLAATFPPGCTTCAANFDGLFDFYASAFPASRGALLSYRPDSVLPPFFGITNSQFDTGLTDLETNRFDPHPNLHYYDAGTAGAFLIGNTSVMINGVSVPQFLTKMVTDDASWASEPPPN